MDLLTHQVSKYQKRSEETEKIIKDLEFKNNNLSERLSRRRSSASSNSNKSTGGGGGDYSGGSAEEQIRPASGKSRATTPSNQGSI